MIIWDVTQDHMQGQPDPLLSAVKAALATPGTLAIQPVGANMALNFATAPLGQYAVQWTSNLTGISWNTLINTNIAGTNGTATVTDHGFSSQNELFYRVKTPP